MILLVKTIKFWQKNEVGVESMDELISSEERQVKRAISIAIDLAKEYENIKHSSEIIRGQPSHLLESQMVLSGYFTFLSPVWSGSKEYDFKINLKLDELIQLYKGATILEFKCGGQLFGSVSCVDKIYGVLAEKDYKSAKEMQAWMINLNIDTLVDYMQEAHLAAMYSKDGKEQKNANFIIASHKSMILEKNRRYESHCRRVFERKSLESYMSENDMKCRQSGEREMFLNELNKLTLEEKLLKLAYDTEHSPKYYPGNIIHETSVEILKSLDSDIQRKLFHRLNISLKKSPWKAFSAKVRESMGIDQKYGIIDLDDETIKNLNL